MAQLFIKRPILAWVFAIFISIAGIIALPLLPVAQYPNVAPPQLSLYTTYPGASPQEIYQGVTRLIEEELNSVDNLIYFESTSDSTGGITINATFQPGTNLQQASVNVQNAIRSVASRLPAAVTAQGVTVEEVTAGFLMLITLTSTDGAVDEVGLGDYLNRNMLGELRRIDGVGKAQLFSAQRAMRVWIDPDKMVGLKLTVGDINTAITTQNAQVAAGQIGAAPNPVSQDLTATVLVKGQLTDIEEFGNIVLRANPDGSTVRLKDVARLEVGAESYNFSSRLNGQPSAAVAIQLSSTGNAVATSAAIKAKLDELSRFFPSGVQYDVPYDTSPFVSASIQKVLMTLLEAVGLVFLVMFVFLQNFRYTVIPTLVVPIALLGTSAAMLATGFSINVLTMFAMVLAIGILVDDAIVVVENVERIMAEEGLSPKAATNKAMTQITSAILGITLVLSSVFIPMAFFPGSTGIIYRQFSLTMVVSILFSAFLALSLTPALCATFLKPIKQGHHDKKGLGGWFNRKFDRLTAGYSRSVTGLVRRAGRVMVVYLALVVGLGYLFVNLPSGFVPNEDQGYFLVDVQGPPEASANRTVASIKQIEEIFKGESAVRDVLVIQGFSFSGSGANAAMVFVTLKDWKERGAGNTVDEITERVNMRLFALKDATSFALSPPPIEGFGTTNGFSFRLQDRSGLGQQALSSAAAKLMAKAEQSPVLTGLRIEGLPDAAQVVLVINREKANTFGVTFADINSTITANLGSSYINDYPNAGRMQRVIVQAQDRDRLQADDLLKLNVRNAGGGMVPLSSFAIAEWQKGAPQIVGYNGYPTVRIAGEPVPGQSTGAAIAEMERLASELPEGFGFEWTGQALEEIKSGSQAPMLFGLSILFVFLLLAGLYESWSIPLSVMLVVPLGAIGCVLAVMMRGMPNDIYFKVGLIAIIGLSAKNAILIVEFAKDYFAQGRSLFDSAVDAARVRFRPIVMTSLAFALGVVPLAIATGPSAASQNAIGTGVLGGIILGTILAIFFVPAFFVFVLKLFRTKRPVEDHEDDKPETGDEVAGKPVA
ncbi:efflux RND transporter permease subunit [Rhodospirillum rubrum]|uniref:Efflux pump membrane transporter n=1 Tax=Rhodospirillum rubrum (strain ATCC 11170 / ATH 1.1.1 / DSM 467 / LMG 4362 / NCIMB 8255 / S1) TaxID=269796 RepID=Q2RVC6_RHORT|nr:efflux RND transporter permease subunit [Rhodospirillum rubrum]ABC21919.1 Hydrophobe/amphiphile efflux-1 HAE1 [Rhodospirillum rubrum ATCC 11170]AEO47622.1 hydrophobe/amphiphile efflux-1 HAE1 [Rhodospirillum rubrum F11]MBK5953486.1 multidrug efflux RND transporter permease subunit [Rhodospirillum rubrum]QXG81577.1 multidrug efflux RND transporter permease subunit [Rhodospirillum rubrum]HAP98450.1 multidrug efflux RND transporter permease subunit [Rhodospirillum rubrum]